MIFCPIHVFSVPHGIMRGRQGARSKFWGVSGSAYRGGGDNSIQFINIGREGDKSFKEWRRKIGGGGGVEGWVTTVF